MYVAREIFNPSSHSCPKILINSVTLSIEGMHQNIEAQDQLTYGFKDVIFLAFQDRRRSNKPRELLAKLRYQVMNENANSGSDYVKHIAKGRLKR